MGIILDKKLALTDLMDQYHHDTASGSQTQYFDPARLPEYYRPTYEHSNNGGQLNAKATVAGFSLNEMRDVDDLYSLMPYEDYLRNMNLTFQALKFRNQPGNEPPRLFQCQLTVCFQLRGKNGKQYYYKRTSIENGSINGKISHVISTWEDVSYLRPGQASFWAIDMPNAEYFDFDLPEISLYRNTLGKQEVKIVRLLARGHSSADIGGLLHISKHTVDTHRRNMLHKLEVANTPQLVDMARDMHIF